MGKKKLIYHKISHLEQGSWMFTGMPLKFYSVMSFNLAFSFIQDLVIFTCLLLSVVSATDS